MLDLTIVGGPGGVETLREIREKDTKVPAIAMSGYSDDDVMANFEKYGFCERVSKPFNLVQAIDKIKEVLAKKQST